MERKVPPALAPCLARYRELLHQRFGDRVIHVRLFGSQARGDNGPDSDVDVAIVVAGLDEAERDEVIDLALDAWRQAGRLGQVPSPLVWSEAELSESLALERAIARDILSEGIEL